MTLPCEEDMVTIKLRLSCPTEFMQRFKISYFKAYLCFGGGVAGMCILSSDSNCAHVLTGTERDRKKCKHSRSLKDKKASVIKPIRTCMFCGEQCESDRVQASESWGGGGGGGENAELRRSTSGEFSWGQLGVFFPSFSSS